MKINIKIGQYLGDKNIQLIDTDFKFLQFYI